MARESSKPEPAAVVKAVLDRNGRTFAQEVGIRVADQPSPLFRLLCMALLMSARIRYTVAVDATKALGDAGWTTAKKLAASSWADRARTLNRSGYARYDERTATMLGDTADLLLGHYGGDLRELREEAGRDPTEERRLLIECKGIGEVGADIFCREAQGVWGELRPFVDRRAVSTARKLGLPTRPHELADLVPANRFPALVAALVRTGLDKDEAEVKAEARG